jgi:sulfur carrier protein
MDEQIQVRLNGEMVAIKRGSTVEALFDAAGIPAERRRGVAIAVNHAVVPRSLWSSTPLNEDDHAEIVTAVQGG